MKRSNVVLVAIMLAVPVLMGQLSPRTIQPVMLSSPQSRWEELGTITSSQAIPAVTDRDYAAVAALTGAKTIVWDLGDDVGRKRQLSFQTTANADSTTVVLLGFADSASTTSAGANTLTDDAVYLGTIVLTGGQQTGKYSNVYADTAVATDGIWSFSVLDSGNDRRCVIEFADKGIKRVVMIATTLQADSTLYAEARKF